MGNAKGRLTAPGGAGPSPSRRGPHASRPAGPTASASRAPVARASPPARPPAAAGSPPTQAGLERTLGQSSPQTRPRIESARRLNITRLAKVGPGQVPNGRIPATKKATTIALTGLAVAVSVASGARANIRPFPKRLQKEKTSRRRSAPACPPGSLRRFRSKVSKRS